MSEPDYDSPGWEIAEEMNQQDEQDLLDGVQRCDQCDVVLTPENRHISGLMCIPCALPVMD